MQSISVFLDIVKFADFSKKNGDFSIAPEVHHMIHVFLDLLLLRYNCFIITGYV